ncbi:MAG: hypothetical protein A2V76_00355 [Candidatus Aminicenantes bacterium RBG_16_63_14]|nr:MAG: hypothetical protein A2V76_00355 [Candidatus Aminicenantes bacterium RBG_16_63_14]
MNLELRTGGTGPVAVRPRRKGMRSLDRRGFQGALLPWSEEPKAPEKGGPEGEGSLFPLRPRGDG